MSTGRPMVSLEGQVVAPEDARVSVFDRGFLYGDSVYEVMRAYEGVPFELEAHLARLESSAERIGMDLPVPLSQLESEVKSLLKESNLDSAYIRVVVTRGSGPINLDVARAEHPRRIIVVQSVADKTPPDMLYETGAKVALVGVRRNLRTAIDPMAKTGNYLNSVLALAEAKRAGAYEAVMLDHRDLITEGASSNFFCVYDSTIITPPLDIGILAGVTRSVVLKLASEASYKVLELPLTEAAARQADEAFITSSIRELVPIVEIDDTTLGSGRPGRVSQELRTRFAQYVAAYVRAHKA